MVGGSPRSGTTLVRVMLDSHANIACGPESHLFCPRLLEKPLSRQFAIPRQQIRRWERDCSNFPEFVGRFLEAHARIQGAAYWAEKTPKNVLNLGWILDRFPNIVFCHVVRDGRAVINSLRSHPRYRLVGDELVPTGVSRDLHECVEQWLRSVRAGLEFSCHPRVTHVRYEDIVADPRAALSPLLARLELEWDPRMERFDQVQSPSRSVAMFPQNPEATQPLYRTSLDRWREELTGDEVEMIERLCRDALTEFEYE